MPGNVFLTGGWFSIACLPDKLESLYSACGLCMGMCSQCEPLLWRCGRHACIVCTIQWFYSGLPCLKRKGGHTHVRHPVLHLLSAKAHCSQHCVTVTVKKRVGWSDSLTAWTCADLEGAMASAVG